MLLYIWCDVRPVRLAEKPRTHERSRLAPILDERAQPRIVNKKLSGFGAFISIGFETRTGMFCVSQFPLPGLL